MTESSKWAAGGYIPSKDERQPVILDRDECVYRIADYQQGRRVCIRREHEDRDCHVTPDEPAQ